MCSYPRALCITELASSFLAFLGSLPQELADMDEEAAFQLSLSPHPLCAKEALSPPTYAQLRVCGACPHS